MIKLGTGFDLFQCSDSRIELEIFISNFPDNLENR